MDGELRVVPYRPELRDDFYRLNVAWLTHYFRVEPEDLRVLAEPEREILAHGGHVYFAVLGREVIGTIGLEREREGVYAVIKMTVDDRYRGHGIGRALLQHAIDEFKRLNGTQLFLETNSALTPALHLYESVGFVQQPEPKAGTAFERADIYMIYAPNT